MWAGFGCVEVVPIQEEVLWVPLVSKLQIGCSRKRLFDSCYLYPIYVLLFYKCF